MPSASPKITNVNGYDVIETSETCFKVYDDDRQYGEDFRSFEEAAAYVDSLTTRLPPRART